jgi:hypothetical protein
MRILVTNGRRISLALALLGLVLLTSCTSGPRGIVSNISREEHPALIAGEMNWGAEVGFDLRNNGKRGVIQIVVVLSSSEGQWSRKQDLVLEAGELRHLAYFFHEPTINVTNLQAMVRVNP